MSSRVTPVCRPSGRQNSGTFGPRFGLAYSPDWGWLTGGAGKTSIRAAYGIYFNRFNAETALQAIASPPFAETSHGIGDIGASPSFANPFTGYALNSSANPVAGCPATTLVCPVSEPIPFPFVIPSNPSSSSFAPLDISVYDPNITIPYAQNFNFTIQRQFGESTIVTLGYVGSEGRHLPMTIELNPVINPPGCNASCVAGIAASVPFQPFVFPR